MKKIVVFAGLLSLMMGVNAQSIIDKLYDKYSGAEGFTTVYISKYMFDMFRNDETPVKAGEDMEQIISKLECIKILVTDDDPATPAPVDLYQEIRTRVRTRARIKL